MKKCVGGWVALLLCLFAGSQVASAQIGKLEVSVLGGVQTYQKYRNTYYHNFSSGFGFGIESKLYMRLRSKAYWTTSLGFSTDDGTELSIAYNNASRIVTLDRQDYTLGTGLGFDFIRLPGLTVYTQLQLGFAYVSGYHSTILSEERGVERFDLNRFTYMVAPSLGADLHLGRDWKLGLVGTFRHFGGFDGSPALMARISYRL